MVVYVMFIPNNKERVQWWQHELQRRMVLAAHLDGATMVGWASLRNCWETPTVARSPAVDMVMIIHIPIVVASFGCFSK